MLSKVKKELKLLLLKDDFLVISLSVYLGFVLQNFLESLVKHLIFPLLNSVVPVNLEDVSFKINNVDINFSEIIQKFINLVIGLVLSYVIIRIMIKHLN
jgi:large-conductance mechanosensitive channel